ncbi:MAG: GntR family transcriptional regulator [Anaerolineae bacterium]|nr:GntR family transcriptional regulator [Anaerolineae bacterium]
MQQIQPIRSKNELVYASLRAAIIHGELAPGERLVIDELAGELGVSQIPIREALRQLEADGFVVSKPHVGATVTDIQASLVTEIFGLLEAMEIISGQAACTRLDETDLKDLERHLRQMDSLLEDPDSWSAANVRFHQTICERAGTPLVQKMMDKALAHWDRLRSHYQLKEVFAQRVAEAHQQHWEMLNAIRDRDCAAVERASRQHNRAALAAYVDYLDAQLQLEEANR